MIVAAHQPHYLPWLGYLDKLAKADLFVVMDDLQYEAQNFQNRQRVKINSGATWLTVPLLHGSQADRICDKRIDNGATGKHAWTHRHWQTLETHYRRAPYFSRYADEVRDIFSRTWTSLLELDMRMLDLARTWLGIKVPIIRSSGLALQGQKTDRILDMCKKVGARAYLSGGGGSTGYLDVEQLGRSGVGVIWQHFEHPRYTQRYGGFVSHLGFLDLVFNVGPQAHAALFDRMHPLEVWR
ncbi:MAG TPA: WbqC family protein [Kofleriaceae bacterium]|nr:WbqC family protein [Kofleriaceae bacterium]